MPLAATARVPALVPARGADRADLAVPVARFAATQPWSLYPLQPGRDLRQRRVLVVRALRPGCWARGPRTGASSTRSPRLGGHKSLYSESFYDQEEFRRLYGGAEYTALKQRYDPDGRLPDLYAKAVRGA